MGFAVVAGAPASAPRPPRRTGTHLRQRRRSPRRSPRGGRTFASTPTPAPAPSRPRRAPATNSPPSCGTSSSTSRAIRRRSPRPPSAPSAIAAAASPSAMSASCPTSCQSSKAPSSSFPTRTTSIHNVFSLSSAAAPNGTGFDLGRYPKGSSRPGRFDTPGTVQVFCHIHHGHERGRARAAPIRIFASPADDHHYRDRRRSRGRLHHRRVARADRTRS